MNRSDPGFQRRGIDYGEDDDAGHGCNDEEDARQDAENDKAEEKEATRVSQMRDRTQQVKVQKPKDKEKDKEKKV